VHLVIATVESQMVCDKSADFLDSSVSAPCHAFALRHGNTSTVLLRVSFHAMKQCLTRTLHAVCHMILAMAMSSMGTNSMQVLFLDVKKDAQHERLMAFVQAARQHLQTAGVT